MKVSIQFPEHINDIPLARYQNLISLNEPTTEESVCALLGISLPDMVNMKAGVVESLIVELSAILNTERTFYDRFTMGGVTYGFIPNLDQITYGENEDIVKYLGDVNTWHKAMAVLYRPITNTLGNSYLIEEYQGSGKYSEVMKGTPLGVVLGAQVFFYNLTKELLRAIPNYLREVVDQQVKNGQLSTESGEAITRLSLSLTATLSESMRLLDSLCTPAYYTSHIWQTKPEQNN